MILAKGQKADLTKGRSVSAISFGLSWRSADSEIDINASAFLLNAGGVCVRDEDFIFYGQQESRNGAIVHAQQSGDIREVIRIDISRIPADIERIAITLTIHDGEIIGKSFGLVSEAACTITDCGSGEQLGDFRFGEDLSLETAIVVGEFYLHKGDWKFNAVGSGFNGGLPKLVTNFGLEVEEEVAAAAEPVTKPAAPIEKSPPEPVHKPAPAAESSSPVQLSKVSLEKQGSVNIRKSGKVTARLEWESAKDLDLYCFYVTANNEVGKIYYRNMGSPQKSPYIQLDGDSKGKGQETITIHKPEELKYVLFAAYSAISNGIGSFYSMKARAVVDNHQGQQVVSSLYEKNNYSYWVAIAHIDFTSPSEMKVSHVEQYSKRFTEKSPLLYEDGSFKMNVGKAEFKSWR
ncbi:TerD family protein [Cohnella phaseoli]|uniref:Tellurite resistance protein TerA n=1 Tax=Cohnella phaseoli TaxID=456490 RepID=A0A3D9KK07_9BACL|nr:TerD family protein [Cohnella phaseoli]RED86487.1 tellurite resistance protein TerA [Cohnella phaseoli]